jgi:hypothetical protein
VLWKPRAGPSTVADEGATTGRTRAKPNPIFYGHYSIECMCTAATTSSIL